MKVPLRFQLTNFDCGAVSLLNAISFLFDREEIPAELVRGISTYTLDCYDEHGNIGQGGTSVEAINMLARWITEYSKQKDFNVVCTHYEKEEVDIELLKKNMNDSTVLFVRCMQTCEHYTIITDIDNEYAYFFDPYYFEEGYYDADDCVEMIFDKPFSYNRKVKLERLFDKQKKDFSLCLGERTECVVIRKKKA